jgi:membrane-bound lytic murein transglycosylase MltF
MLQSHFSSGRMLRTTVACLTVLATVASSVALAQTKPKPASPQPAAGSQASAGGQASAALSIARKPWTGDLDAMIKRRVVRVLVPHSKTHYYVDRGQPRGIAYEAVNAWAEGLNKGRGHLKVIVAFLPTTRDKLLSDLAAGLGDLAVAGLTVTPEREKVVDFSIPTTNRPVSEIVVTGPESPQLTSIADLSGKEVFVRKSSSYWQHLSQLNERFAKEGKPPVSLRAAPEDLEDEDLLEMLNAGLAKIVVVDDYIATLWAKIYKAIKPRPDLEVHGGGQLAWAFRPNSPQLKQSIDAFVKTHGQGTTFGNTIIKRYTASSTFVRNATAAAEVEKFNKLVDLFRKYGDKYGVDYVLMMAQGYQESRLDQRVKSRVGAIGVMQVMPATGKELKVGDVTQTEPNIHAGVKYLRFMVDQYFAKEPMTQINKGLFAFASYNAGPRRVRELREEAAKRGFDPNVWFNNVEVIAAEKIGAETVTYVSNIYKYYVAYRLLIEDNERAKTMKPKSPTS